MAVTSKAAVRISLLFLSLVAVQFLALIRETRIIGGFSKTDNTKQQQQELPQKPWDFPNALDDDDTERGGIRGYGDENYWDAPMEGWAGTTKPKPWDLLSDSFDSGDGGHRGGRESELLEWSSGRGCRAQAGIQTCERTRQWFESEHWRCSAGSEAFSKEGCCFKRGSRIRQGFTKVGQPANGWLRVLWDRGAERVCAT